MRIAISLPEPDLRDADKLAKALRLSRSALIRLALLEYLAKKGPPNSD